MTDLFPRARDPDVLPPGASLFSVTIPPGAAADFTRAEIEPPAFLAKATAGRRLQFLAGRICARAAIAGLAPDLAAAALPRDADGCPAWPAGLVGSITHTETFAAAAAAPSGAARGLGIDAEPILSEDAAAEVARVVASPAETRRAAAAGLAPLPALTLVFSAKESLFKALYPPTRRHFDYLDCELVEIDAATRCFRIRFDAIRAAEFGGETFEGRYDCADGAVRTGVLLPRADAARRG